MHGAFLPLRIITCNQCWDDMLTWYETKVLSVTVRAGLAVFVACRSVGVLGCLQRCVGVKHDLVGMCAHLCVFLFVLRQYCSRICQKTMFLLVSHILSLNESHTKKLRYRNELLRHVTPLYVWLNSKYVRIFFFLLTANYSLNSRQIQLLRKRWRSHCINTTNISYILIFLFFNFAVILGQKHIKYDEFSDCWSFKRTKIIKKHTKNRLLRTFWTNWWEKQAKINFKKAKCVTMKCKNLFLLHRLFALIVPT